MGEAQQPVGTWESSRQAPSPLHSSQATGVHPRQPLNSCRGKAMDPLPVQDLDEAESVAEPRLEGPGKPAEAAPGKSTVNEEGWRGQRGREDKTAGSPGAGEARQGTTSLRSKGSFLSLVLHSTFFHWVLGSPKESK
jgi:hypothetical protein